MIDKEKLNEIIKDYRRIEQDNGFLSKKRKVLLKLAELYLAGKLQEEQFFKEKLIRENGYKPMLTLVCRKCGHKQIIIYTGNKNIPCPGCKKRR